MVMRRAHECMDYEWVVAPEEGYTKVYTKREDFDERWAKEGIIVDKMIPLVFID